MSEDITVQTHINFRTRTRPLRLGQVPEQKGPTHPQMLCKAFPSGMYRLTQTIQINEPTGAPWAKEIQRAGRFFILRHRKVQGVRYPHLQRLGSDAWITGQRTPELFLALMPHLQRLTEAEGLCVMLRALGLNAQDLFAVLIEQGVTFARLENLLEVALHQKAKRARQGEITQPQRPAA